jgi:stearoyl-CoA desaturase (delta-9 desaturase)
MTVVTKTSASKNKYQKIERDQAITDQFLSADLEEMERLQEASKKIKFRGSVVWRNVILFVFLHLGAFWGLYHMFTQAKWATVAWAFGLWVFSGVGITAGAHRLWAHRSYKATLPARIILMICQTMAFQNDIIEWARDHRCHHKWTDTDADPHNTRRGFFFAHMGWLLVKKHPQVRENGQKLDLSDLFQDPVCAFQRKYYLPLVALVCFLLPTAIPVYFWGESALVAYTTAALFRYCWTLHATWCVNSFAHYIGYKPYDRKITSVESMWTTLIAVGEGGHNFHHTFPQDYRASEYSIQYNWTRMLIDTFAALGWVYDRKTVADDVIQRQIEKYGGLKGHEH